MLVALGIGMFIWCVATFLPYAILKDKTWIGIDWLGTAFWACLVIVLLSAAGIAELRNESAYTSIFKTIVIIAGCAFALTSILRRLDKAIDGKMDMTIKKGDASITISDKKPRKTNKRKVVRKEPAK
jgi:hypothetical protein